MKEPLNETEKYTDVEAARGIIIGIIISLCFWGGLLALLFGP